MEEKKTPESKIRSNAKYDARMAKYYRLKLNKGTDADIIEHLSQFDNFQGYIKSLIRADIASRDSKTV